MSLADLLLECSRWADPRLVAAKSEPREEAVFGTATHVLLAHKLKALDIGRDQDLAAWCAKEQAAGTDVNAADVLANRASDALLGWLRIGNPYGVDFSPRPFKIERALAYDLEADTARECEPPTEDDHTYSDVDFTKEIPGTADLIVLPGSKGGNRPASSNRLQRTAVVIDFKTGQGPFRPQTMGQLWALALAASRAYDFENVILAVLHARRDGGVPVVYASERFGKVSLSNFRKKLLKAWRRRLDGSLRPGAHCLEKYCPAYSACEAHSTGLVQISARRDLTRPGSPEEIGKAHQLLAQYAALAEATKDWMRMSVKVNGQPGIRPDGQIVRLVPVERENLSKASIKRALGENEGEKMIEQLRKKGCIEKGARLELRAGKGDW
jgi:hypothetical protein